MAALICILCGLPKGDRVASSRFLKSTSRRYRNSKKTLYGPYCKVVQKSGVWQPDYESKGAALVATVFVHFHNNKFKFLNKHKTA